MSRAIYDKDLNQAIQKGVNEIADLVSVTLSSQGRMVVVELPNGTHFTTKDGVTVVSNYHSDDKLANLAVRELIDAGIATNQETDDGTTSTVVLGREIYNRGRKYMKKYTDVIRFKEGVELAIGDVVNHLKSQATDPSMLEYHDKLAIATVSAAGDQKIGQFVTEVIEQAGDFDINYKTPAKPELRYEIEPAYIIPGGIANTTINTTRKEPVMNPYVLIFPRLISDPNEFHSFVMKVLPQLKRGEGVLIFCQDILGGVNEITRKVYEDTGVLFLAFKTQNEVDKAVPQQEFLDDLSAFTGATITDCSLAEVMLIDMVRIEQALVDKKECTLIHNPSGIKYDTQIANLDKRIEEETDEVARERFEVRKTKLFGKLLNIYHRGQNPSETIEQRGRLQDAIPALKNAIKSGTLPGGGLALVNAGRALKYRWAEIKLTHNRDVALGYKTVIDSLPAQAKQVIQNTGVNPFWILSRMGDERGYDVNAGKLVNMREAGIIDPTNVVYTALSAGARAAANLLLLGAALLNSQEYEKTQVTDKRR